MDTNLLPIAIAVFLTASLLVVGIYMVIVDIAERRNGASKATQIPVRQPMEVAATLEAATSSLNTRDSETSNRWEAFSLWVEQSGMRLNPVSLVVVSGVLGAASAAIVGVLLFSWWSPILASH